MTVLQVFIIRKNLSYSLGFSIETQVRFIQKSYYTHEKKLHNAGCITGPYLRNDLIYFHGFSIGNTGSFHTNVYYTHENKFTYR